MTGIRLLALLLAVPLLAGCTSMMREMGANNEWESCRNPSCTLCSGTGLVDCTRCTPQGETQCENCHGTGLEDTPLQAECAQCQGRGYLFTATGMQVKCSECNATGQRTVYEKRQCPGCGGRGWAACPDCGGDRQKMHGRWVKVYEDGQRIPKPWMTAP